MDTGLWPGKEGLRQNTPHHRPTTSQPMSPSTKTQSRIMEHHSRNRGEEGSFLGHHTRSQGFLPPPTNEQDNAEVDEIPVQQSELSDPSNALWLGPQPMVGKQVHQTDQRMDEHTTMGLGGWMTYSSLHKPSKRWRGELQCSFIK